MEGASDAKDEEHAYAHRTHAAIHHWLQQPPPDGTTLVITTMTGEATLADQYVERWEELQAAQQEPYFGRVDFHPATESATQPIYIGRTGVRAPESGTILIHDWRAPISSLFYIRGFQQVSYLAPKGRVDGDIALRRRFHFVNGVLQRFSDERPTGATLAANAEADDYLVELLADARGEGLRDIIATIQAEQHDLIRAPLAGILLIQGVAGSGKTSVALHRLSYLLYTYPDQLHPDHTMIIGPNPLFLAAIAPLFPQLGIANMQQLTFAAWARALVGDALPPTSAETSESHETSLNPSTDRHIAQAAYQRARLLGSIRMIDLMHAHMALRHDERLAAAAPLTLTYVLPRDTARGPSLLYAHAGDEACVQVTVAQVQEALRRAARSGNQVWKLTPERQQRAHFLDACMETLWQSFTRTRAYGVPLEERIHKYRRTAFQRVMREQLEREVQHWWPPLLPATVVTQLLGDRIRLAEVAATLHPPLKAWTSDELDVVAIPDAANPAWTEEDLAVLCLAHLLLAGRQDRHYEYIVLDEAQDRSALELALLRLFADNMTLVGDLAQGVFVQHGVRTWKEATTALGGGVDFHRVERSYRSTWEITQLANHILANGRFAQAMPPALPLERHGAPPAILACTDERHMIAEALLQLQQMHAAGHQRIALIGKTMAACQHLFPLLTTGSSTSITFIDTPDRSLAHPIVLLPVWLAKGLEFDGVVVLDADAQTYSTREADAKLLYVAVTRALHHLAILHTGQPSALLAT